VAIKSHPTILCIHDLGSIVKVQDRVGFGFLAARWMKNYFHQEILDESLLLHQLFDQSYQIINFLPLGPARRSCFAENET
jgi:hypothetical protein